MAKEKNIGAMVGAWAFIVGMITAVILGVFSTIPGMAWLLTILVVMGLIVGFFNVSGKETSSYLLAAVSLVIVTAFGGNVIGSIGAGTNLAWIGISLQGVLNAMTTFTVPAAIIVALKQIYGLAKDN